LSVISRQRIEFHASTESDELTTDKLVTDN